VGLRLHAGGSLQVTIALENLLYAAVGILVMFAGYILFDKLTPRVSFPDELGKGNVAVAICIAALFLALAYIIGRSLD
jgi:uncharacterized membrane protein YjfL (UPF0719 family)